MSIIHFGAVSAASAESANVTLSGGFVSSDHLITAIAGFRFTENGTVFSNDRGSYIQIESDTDWIIPNEEASIDYQIRYHYVGGVIIVPGLSDLLDTWLTLDVGREWNSRGTFQGSNGTTINYADIRFGDGTHPKNNVAALWDGEPCMATAEYETSVNGTPP